MSEDQTPDETDEKEGWFVDQTIHINLPSEIAEADLIASLVPRLRCYYNSHRK